MNKFIVFLFISILISSCNQKFPVEKGKTVFKYNESAGISSLDPAFARDQANIWADNQLYNGLVQLDDSLIIKPCISKYWEITNNGKTYYFHLRNDVYFHDNKAFASGKGRKAVASDFVYSLKRILNPKTLSAGTVWLQDIIAKNDSDYEIIALNDSLLQINLTKPFSSFLGRLSMPYFSVVPFEAVNYYGQDFGRNPVGTGPFYFKMWKEGIKLVLLKNEHYFEKENNIRLPFLDAISISFIIDKQSVFLEFIKGNIDFISGIDPSYKDELLLHNGTLNPKYSNKINMSTSAYLNTEYLGFLMKNNGENIILKPEIRKAINYGFDRKKMMKYLRNNIGIAGENGFVPIGMPGFKKGETKGYFYSPDSSLKLMKEAGYPNGEGLPTITLSTTSNYLDICKYIQQELNKIGIKIEIEIQQPASLRQMVANNKIPFFRGSWIADYADAENYLSLFYSKNYAPKGTNYTCFSSSKFDKLYEKSRLETNDSIRKTLNQQMDKLIIDEAPVVVLYYDEVLRFSSKKISDLGINSMNLLNLKRVKKAIN